PEIVAGDSHRSTHLATSLFSCGTKNVADYGAHQRKNHWKSLVEDLLPRAFGIDEVENRRKYKQCQKPNQNCVRHSDLARFQIRVGGRSPDDKPGENDHRDKGNKPEIDQQIVFDHGFDSLACFSPALARGAGLRSWTPATGTRRCATYRPRSPPSCGRSRSR